MIIKRTPCAQSPSFNFCLGSAAEPALLVAALATVPRGMAGLKKRGEIY